MGSEWTPKLPKLQIIMTSTNDNSLRIRTARAEDADALAWLARQLLLYEKSLNDTMGELTAWAAARNLATTLLRRPRPNVETVGGYIAGAFVREDARRANAGRMLVAAAENWLRAQGIATSELHVLHFNDGARRFWAEIGYEPLTLGMRKKL